VISGSRDKILTASNGDVGILRLEGGLAVTIAVVNDSVQQPLATER
jgi:hypothetical protein